MSTDARNALIVVALAAAVYAIPGGGDSADFVAALLGILITASFAFIGYRLYRENRVAFFSLGDRYRGMLYGAIGAIVFAMAARVRLFESGPGALLWVVLVAGAIYALVLVFRHHRSYDY
ncbi:MAG: hypothetical protein JWO90_2406 [Solirubrobacterales bacterium]|jgi:hypothetical protein|nr:hypothetical protein [Solirubrobacterales bacterium]